MQLQSYFFALIAIFQRFKADILASVPKNPLYFFVFTINLILLSDNYTNLKSITMGDGIEVNGDHHKEEIFSKAVRAGKRTYFFDVKATKGNDYYLTITESKKRFGDDGKFFYEKHKLFLYKEDFDKFAEGLSEAVGHIKSIAPAIVTNHDHSTPAVQKNESGDFSDVNFDDLGK